MDLNSTGVRLKRPAIHDGRVAFVANDDLWIGDIQSGKAECVLEVQGRIQNVFFSPTGDALAFTWNRSGVYQIYVLPLDTKKPRQLTFHRVQAECLGWSRLNGKILFRSERNHPLARNRIFSVPADGGLCTPLNLPEAEFAVEDEHGRIVFVPHSVESTLHKGNRGGRIDQLWLWDGIQYQQLCDGQSVDTTPAWVGNQIYFVSDRATSCAGREVRFVGQLYALDPDNNNSEPRQVTDIPGDFRYPVSDGVNLVFEWGFGIALYSPESGYIRPLPFRVDPKPASRRNRTGKPSRLAARLELPQPRRHAVSPDGAQAVIEVRGQLLKLEAGTGNRLGVISLPGSRCAYPAVAPDGKRLAFISDHVEAGGTPAERLWIVEEDGEPRPVTGEIRGVMERPVWAPDGKALALADHLGRLLLVQPNGSPPVVVDQALQMEQLTKANTSYRFSPEGRWLLYAIENETATPVIRAYDRETHRRYQLTSPDIRCTTPAFLPGGNRIAFLADTRVARVTQHFPGGFDVARVSACVATLPFPPPELPATDEARETDRIAELTDLSASLLEDLNFLLEEIRQPARLDAAHGLLLVHTNNTLSAYNAQAPGVVSQPIWSQSNVTDYWMQANSGVLLFARARKLEMLSLPSSTPSLIPLDAEELEISRLDEWKQMVRETWRLARDLFWHPELNHVEWARLLPVYERQVEAVANRQELNALLAEMIRELRASHMDVSGGDLEPDDTIPEDGGGDGVGFLGADLEFEPSGPAWKIRRILRCSPYRPDLRSPLRAPLLGVSEGEYILAVNGEEVCACKDPGELFRGKAEQEVELTLSPTLDRTRARTVRVTCIPNEEDLRTLDWIEARRSWVREVFGEDVAYVRVGDMQDQGLTQFLLGYHANVHRKGLIIDVRNNSGGNISNTLFLYLDAIPDTKIKPREGRSYLRAGYAFTGEVVVLCNEYSQSNAEEFSHVAKTRRRVTVIGRKTEGSGVGKNVRTLVDGGSVHLPDFGMWDPCNVEWIVEGCGVEPNHVVEWDPKAEQEGDPIFDAALAFMQERLKTKPPRIKLWRQDSGELPHYGDTFPHSPDADHPPYP